MPNYNSQHFVPISCDVMGKNRCDICYRHSTAVPSLTLTQGDLE